MMYEVAAEERGGKDRESKKGKETKQVVQLCCINKASYMYFVAALQWSR